MPLNPLTGEIEGYDSPSTQAGIGMTAMAAAGMDVPLAFRMLEVSPGFISAFGFSINRGANTLIKGGSKPSLLKFDPTTGTFDRSKDFFGSGRIIRGKGAIGRRATRLAADSTKTAFLRPALRTNSLRPRNLTQLTDLSAFADSKYKRYTPFGASGFLGNTKAGGYLTKKMGIQLEAGESAFGPGLLSSVTAGRRIDLLEKKALKGNARAMKKLTTVDKNIGTLANMNNKVFVKGERIRTFVPAGGVLESITYKGGQARVAKGATVRVMTGTGDAAAYKVYKGGQFLPRDARVPIFTRGASSFTAAQESLVMGKDIGKVGVRGNMMASSMAGGMTRYLAGYTRGALGFGGEAGLFGRALEGAARAEGHFATAVGKAFGAEGLTLKGGRTIVSKEAAETFLRSTGGRAFFKEVGAKNIAKMAATKQGAAFLGARAGAMAIPGLNIIATASLVYDLGRMAGEVVKSGIELARDAGRSLQGTIAKPMFGMGYKDTEAAATSRSRGVMAIQNSRLNMRSLLGSEAAMMAAHYG